jgi:hypothetical protein
MGDGYDDNQSGPEIEKGRNARQQVFGGGLLMLLVRHFESDQNAEWLMSAGYPFRRASSGQQYHQAGHADSEYRV